jgi:hypothetical protein
MSRFAHLFDPEFRQASINEPDEGIEPLSVLFERLMNRVDVPISQLRRAAPGLHSVYEDAMTIDSFENDFRLMNASDQNMIWLVSNPITELVRIGDTFNWPDEDSYGTVKIYYVKSPKHEDSRPRMRLPEHVYVTASMHALGNSYCDKVPCVHDSISNYNRLSLFRDWKEFRIYRLNQKIVVRSEVDENNTFRKFVKLYVNYGRVADLDNTYEVAFINTAENLAYWHAVAMNGLPGTSSDRYYVTVPHKKVGGMVTCMDSLPSRYIVMIDKLSEQEYTQFCFNKQMYVVEISNQIFDLETQWYNTPFQLHTNSGSWHIDPAYVFGSNFFSIGSKWHHLCADKGAGYSTSKHFPLVQHHEETDLYFHSPYELAEISYRDHGDRVNKKEIFYGESHIPINLANDHRMAPWNDNVYTLDNNMISYYILLESMSHGVFVPSVISNLIFRYCGRQNEYNDLPIAQDEVFCNELTRSEHNWHPEIAGNRFVYYMQIINLGGHCVVSLSEAVKSNICERWVSNILPFSYGSYYYCHKFFMSFGLHYEPVDAASVRYGRLFNESTGQTQEPLFVIHCVTIVPTIGCNKVISNTVNFIGQYKETRECPAFHPMFRSLYVDGSPEALKLYWVTGEPKAIIRTFLRDFHGSLGFLIGCHVAFGMKHAGSAGIVCLHHKIKFRRLSADENSWFEKKACMMRLMVEAALEVSEKITDVGTRLSDTTRSCVQLLTSNDSAYEIAEHCATYNRITDERWFYLTQRRVPKEDERVGRIWTNMSSATRSECQWVTDTFRPDTLPRAFITPSIPKFHFGFLNFEFGKGINHKKDSFKPKRLHFT